MPLRIHKHLSYEQCITTPPPPRLDPWPATAQGWVRFSPGGPVTGVRYVIFYLWVSLRYGPSGAATKEYYPKNTGKSIQFSTYVRTTGDPSILHTGMLYYCTAPVPAPASPQTATPSHRLYLH